jgi:NADH-quinone oxidoreductase subunit C
MSDEVARDDVMRVRADEWRATAERLRAEGFDFLQNLTAVDWIKEERIELVYHLWSYARRQERVVKIDLPRGEPTVPSVADVWRAANWYEREQYDLFGVGFAGHPDLRRILLPDDWPGHPMRKDYVEAPSYNGMPTTRANTLELLPIWDKPTWDKTGDKK